MDDVRRYIVRKRDRKKENPYISVFNISGLDGQLTYEPRMPGKGPALYRVLRKKLLGEHDSLLLTWDDLDLGADVKDMDTKVLIFDSHLRIRTDHPLLGEGGPEIALLHGPVENEALKEIEERSIPHFTILDNDGDLDIGAFLDALENMKSKAIMVDGKDGISDLLMNNGLVDTVLNTLVPIISGHLKIKRFSSTFELREIGNVRMGEEVVYYGTPKNIE
jgi:hypothetical protein